jgi:hypothetical protein
VSTRFVCPRITGPTKAFKASVVVRPPLLLMAEAVEEVRAIKFCTTIAPINCACSNIDSPMSRILNHCFKSFELRDFFNSLGQEATFRACPM